MTTTDPNAPRAVLRLPQVLSYVGLSKSTLYARIRGGQFPRPISLGGNAVAWRLRELDDWLESRPPADGAAA